MKKIVKAGIAESKTTRKKKRAKVAITRSKPFVQPEEKVEAAVSDATGYAECSAETPTILERVPSIPYADAIDPLEDHSCGPIFLEHASDDGTGLDEEGAGTGWYLLLFVGLVAFGLLAYWAVS